MTVVSAKLKPRKTKTSDANIASRGRFAELSEDKLRGGYYTSPELAKWLCDWAIQCKTDTVLEPSCGDGVFLNAAVKRFQELGAVSHEIPHLLTGIEIIEAEAMSAVDRLEPKLGRMAETVVKHTEFFAWWKEAKQPTFKAIIGNPPFIRYQSFPEPHRSIAMEIMEDQGLAPNRLTNIWVPFVVAATASLKLGGRLALVLPAEILQVTYAAQLRSFLTDHFERIDVIACNELFFENAEQEVVLLIADGALGRASKDNVCRVSMTAAKTVSEITDKKPDILLAKTEAKTVHHDSEKWLKYFLNNKQISFMRALREAETTAPMSTHAHINVGVANNLH